jgi:hypothetical protein
MSAKRSQTRFDSNNYTDLVRSEMAIARKSLALRHAAGNFRPWNPVGIFAVGFSICLCGPHPAVRRHPSV